MHHSTHAHPPASERRPWRVQHICAQDALHVGDSIEQVPQLHCSEDGSDIVLHESRLVNSIHGKCCASRGMYADFPCDWSLAAYLKILYHLPHFQIFLQGARVRPLLRAAPCVSWVQRVSQSAPSRAMVWKSDDSNAILRRARHSDVAMREQHSARPPRGAPKPHMCGSRHCSVSTGQLCERVSV